MIDSVGLLESKAQAFGAQKIGINMVVVDVVAVPGGAGFVFS